jgi:hypothetical protein
MSRIMDKNGVCYMTQAIEGLILKREKRSVKIYKAYDIPESFSCRIGQKKTYKIDIDQDILNASQAKMVISTCSGKSSDGSVHEILLNGKRISDNFGRFHNYSYDMLSVPIEMLQKAQMK